MDNNTLLGFLSDRKVNMLQRPAEPYLRSTAPSLYGFLGGLMGTAPDEMAGSVMDPNTAAVLPPQAQCRRPPWCSLVRMAPAHQIERCCSQPRPLSAIHLNPRLRAPQRVHDGAETPSTITLKPASTIAEIRKQSPK